MAALGQDLRWRRPSPSVRRADLVIVEHNSRVLENYPLLASRPPRVGLWGHGVAGVGTGHRFADRLKDWQLRRCTHYFAYTDAGARHVMGAGLPQHRVTVVKNSVDTREIRTARCEVTALDVERTRSELRLAETSVFFVGGLDAPKRLAFLLRAAEAVSTAIPGFVLVVAGDGEERELVQRKASEVTWLRYIGRVGARRKAELASVCDLMLMPGRVGLVAVDSFAIGCPIVTTDWPGHAPEYEYLRHGDNSWTTADSTDAYAGAVLDLLHDPERLARLRTGCIDSAEGFSVESMAARFAGGVLTALAAEESRAAPTG